MRQAKGPDFESQSLMSSRVSYQNKVGDCVKTFGGPVDLLERSVSFLMHPACAPTRGVYPIEGRVSGFLGACVFARRLAEGFSRCSHIKEIVSYLKKKTELRGIVSYIPKLSLTCIPDDCSATRGSDDKSRRL